jgi:hypothetical protein
MILHRIPSVASFIYALQSIDNLLCTQLTAYVDANQSFGADPELRNSTIFAKKLATTSTQKRSTSNSSSTVGVTSLFWIHEK